MNWKALLYILGGYVILLCCSFGLVTILANLHSPITKTIVTGLWAWIMVTIALNGKELSKK